MNRQYKGSEGEAAARDYLTGIGAEIVASNARVAGNEIDIIARIGDVLAFVEVKARTSTRFGRPAEAVTPSKIRGIVRAARAYAAMNGLTDMPMRFDVIEILPGEIVHIPGAFDASE